MTPKVPLSGNGFHKSRTSNSQIQVCWQWQKGKCTKGNACPFRHSYEKSGPQNVTASTSTQLPVHDNSSQRGPALRLRTENDPLDDLKMMSKQFNRSKQLSTLKEFEKFVQVAHSALELPSRDLQSKAVTILSERDDGAREIVRYVAEMVGWRVPPFADLNFELHIVPFMKLLVHDIFTRTCVEKNLIYLMKAVYGDGERGDRFLTRIVDLLEERVRNLESEMAVRLAQEYCSLLCQVLHHIVRRNTEAAEHNELRQHHARLLVVANELRRTRSPSVGYIDNLLSETAAYLFPTATASDQRLGSPSHLPMRNRRYDQLERLMDLPGRHSPSGPRHDNDSDTLNNIRILPTKNEILSSRPEYLPINDNSAPHFLDGAARLFDIHFRLLREDMIGPMRTTVKVILDQTTSSDSLSKTLSHIQNTRDPVFASTRLYFKVAIDGIRFDKRKSLVFRLKFQQPSKFRPLRRKERVEYWKTIRCLNKDSLLCLVSKAIDLHCFLTVVEKDEKKLGQDEHWCEIDVRFEDGDPSAQESLLRLFSERIKAGDTLMLVEFSGVLLEAYQSILKSLQRRSASPYLPFSRTLCPTPAERQIYDPARKVIVVQPPLYATSLEFLYDLAPIRNNGNSPEPLLLSPDASPTDADIVLRLQAETTLDEGQCTGLIAALTQELALIQGPPGTGKTYLGVELMKVLLHNKRKLNLGPVIVICYTNHALDQFLEHLIPVTKSIVRIGSRSKSALLEEYNLWELVSNQQSTLKSGSEKYSERSEYASIDEITTKGTSYCEQLSVPSKMHWHEVSELLKQNYPHHYEQLHSETSEDGFTRVGSKGGSFFKFWKHCHDLRSRRLYEDDIENDLNRNMSRNPRKLDALLSPTINMWDLNEKERNILLRHWATQMRQQWIDKLIIQAEEHREHRQELDTLQSEYKRRVLEGADIVGLTTTGLARDVSLLESVKPKTLICEEAGEVLESHILTALLPSIEHCILIGDHMQLRPKVANYELSVENNRPDKHNLDMSLFERISSTGIPSTTMANFEFPLAQLTTQRRMRPEIADLVRRPLYPALKDHPSVQHYPPVSGMYHSLYWFEHENREDGSGPMDLKETSHSNQFEVTMATELVAYLMKQDGYCEGDIVVLTPYLGQLRKLRSSFARAFSVQLSERDSNELAELDLLEIPSEITSDTAARKPLSQTVRIATVDNFQGEEAKIIIVSLVRSNERGNVGFLKTSNRINVLLSRAQHGMYIIGDANCAKGVKMWEEVIQILRSCDKIGPKLPLRCSRHADTIMEVSGPGEFEIVAPEGGCRELCNKRLECGHGCEYLCHSEAVHKRKECRKPCDRGRPDCRHACSKRCYQDCGKCAVIIPDLSLPCGHTLSKPECWLSRNLSHPKAKCTTKVVRKLPRCRHDAEMLCGDDLNGFVCRKRCDGSIACKHSRCLNQCSKCLATAANSEDGSHHAPCQQLCDNVFKTCSHRCRRKCHDGDCGSCGQKCQLQCVHSRCSGVCGEYCVPCAEKCAWQCEHMGLCEMPCGAPCDRLPCNKRCSQVLKCGHRCPSVCGEICPPKDFCQLCCPDDKRKAEVELIEMATFGDIDVDLDPVIVLPCQHFYTTSFLDRYMEMEKVYRQDPEGSFIESIPSGDLVLSQKCCPECRMPISGIQRYNRVFKRATLDSMLRTIIVRSQERYIAIVTQVDEFEAQLETERVGKLRELVPLTSSRFAQPVRAQNEAIIVNWLDRFRPICSTVQEYTKQADEKTQPHMKVFENSIAARDRRAQHSEVNKGGLATSPPLDIPSPEPKHRILGNILQLRLDVLRLKERMRFAGHLQKLKGGDKDASRLSRDTVKSCKSSLKNTKPLQMECDKRKYYSLTIEILLLELELVCLQSPSAARLPNQLRGEALGILAKCHRYMTSSPSCEKYRDAVNRGEAMLNSNSTFFEPVTADERKAVLAAMQMEFRGTGHWYYCRNGHPFTIADCGMPMQEARCPECGARIGGHDHVLVEGVMRANDLEREL